MGKWKGFILNIKKEGEDKMMLFNLDEDPTEQHDVAAQHPDIIKTMREKMKESHEDPAIDLFAM